MILPDEQLDDFKSTAEQLIKHVDELKVIISQFNDNDSIVLSIRTMADINKISAAADSLDMEVQNFLNSKLQDFKNEPQKIPDQLLIIRHKMRMLTGIIKGYSEMVIEDLEGDQLTLLINKLIPILDISKKIILLIDELREKPDAPLADLQKLAAQLQDEKASVLSVRDFSIYMKEADTASAILIVDDSDSNCELLNNWLQRKNYQTYTAKSGKQAIAMLEEHPEIALILLDVMMPFMNGYEVLLNIKSNEKTAEKMVIMISGMDEIDTVVRCIMNGAEDYLVKPFNPYLLAARIYSCFEKKRLRAVEKAYLEELSFLYFLNSY